MELYNIEYIHGFPYWGDGGSSPTSRKFAQPPTWKKSSPVDSTKFLFRPHQRLIYVITNKNFIFNCSHCSCTIFILTSYSLYTQGHANFDFNRCSIVTEVLFSFEKDSNGQNHSSLGTHHPLTLFGKL